MWVRGSSCRAECERGHGGDFWKDHKLDCHFAGQEVHCFIFFFRVMRDSFGLTQVIHGLKPEPVSGPISCYL